MSNAKRISMVLACVIGLVMAIGITAGAADEQASVEQAKEAAQPAVVFLAEAFLVEVPTEQLYTSGVDPISMGGKVTTVEVLSECLKNKNARVTAGLKALVLKDDGASIRDNRKMWLTVKTNPANTTTSQYDASTNLELVVRFGNGGLIIDYTFNQSMPTQTAEDIGPTIRSLNWRGMALVQDARPTIVASQLDADNAVFLVLSVKRLDPETD